MRYEFIKKPFSCNKIMKANNKTSSKVVQLEKDMKPTPINPFQFDFQCKIPGSLILPEKQIIKL